MNLRRLKPSQVVEAFTSLFSSRYPNGDIKIVQFETEGFPREFFFGINESKILENLFKQTKFLFEIEIALGTGIANELKGFTHCKSSSGLFRFAGELAHLLFVGGHYFEWSDTKHNNGNVLTSQHCFDVVLNFINEFLGYHYNEFMVISTTNAIDTFYIFNLNSRAITIMCILDTD